ncbi:glucose/arabinose dehydrogenase [Kibdelosporangium banguiense]|uniref:Glucose/arabinose dehydrogenase n=1 Tax=Kibdelosporangium banguiense TaxID=1365924 RepID=A0ABS4T7D8_9PSEU|nr:PQQ-dependent sugar dehydrogenase [Kibdelosporangium banguiense]MBP2320335.1 glucose/arabinose dehydrogenase [Kibdelosporangium banguiense]
MTANAAPSLKPGFVLRDTQTGFTPGFQGDLLTDFTFLPDESMLVAGKYGKVNWVPKTGAPRQIANLPSVTDQDMGLQGITVAPDYANSRTVYTTRTVPASGSGAGDFGVLRLSRWSVTVDSSGKPTGLVDERTVLQTSADSNAHGISTVIADEDGTLWVSVGDSADYASESWDLLAFRALDLNDPHGKVLHIKPDGTGVSSNPYYQAANPNSVRSKVYASGFRSPFRFSLDPATNQPILGDVGWDTFEEINRVAPGNSYGWPCWEGEQPTRIYKEQAQCAGVSGVPPMWTYPRSEGSSVIGGVIYQGKNYPAEYQGRYFFADYTSSNLWTMAVDAEGAVPEQFGTDAGAIVKFGATPVGGDIVWADIETSTVRRLVYAPGNNPPVAEVSATNDPATRKVTFNAEKTWDPNGDELVYNWEFGDGTSGTGKVVEHVYPAGTSFTAKLIATDPQNASGTKTITVYPGNNAPVVQLQRSDPQQRYAVGDVISATATATDVEDGNVEVSWNVNTLHCRGVGNCHNHPGARQTGPNFRLPFEGHSGDTQLQITVTATDSKGAQSSQTVTALPKQRRITIESNAPAEFELGDERGATALFTVGMNVTITAPETAADNASTFGGWSDNAPRQRTQRMPDADLTFRASYLSPIERRYNTDAAARQILGAPVEAEQGDGDVRWRVYQGGRLYWSHATGVHLVMGEILAKYLAVGGHQAFGLPTTDELIPQDTRGRYNLFEGGRSIYWTSTTGAHPVFGAIYEKWDARGAEMFNGFPTTDELPTTGNVGRFNAFERGYIYWSNATGANEVHGMIYDRWASLGWERSAVGYPTTDETETPDRIGRFNHFQFGSIYWHPDLGAWEIRGMIRDKWAAMGWETSVLGYPITNETETPDRIGRFNHFQKSGGSIYWHPSLGAFAVYGLIRQRWANLGWETSYLGYPKSDEYEWNGMRRSDFQNGYITYNPATNELIDRRY